MSAMSEPDATINELGSLRERAMDAFAELAAALEVLPDRFSEFANFELDVATDRVRNAMQDVAQVEPAPDLFEQMGMPR